MQECASNSLQTSLAMHSRSVEIRAVSFADLPVAIEDQHFVDQAAEVIAVNDFRAVVQ